MSEQKRPNFLFIMADQYRWDHIACLGEHPVDTPNLDKLASEGSIFRQCITNAPVCSPARISLATGMHLHHTGAFSNASFVSINNQTYYERLRNHDYRVAAIGKFDLAKDLSDNGNGKRPSNYRWGFTDPLEVEGKMHAGYGNPVVKGPYTRMLEERGLLEAFRDDYEVRRSNGWATTCHDSVLPMDCFADIYIGQQSVKWLQEAEKDYPWHLFVSFVGPHDPFDPPKEYADAFRDAPHNEPIKDTCTDRPNWIRRKQNAFKQDNVTECRRQYMASIKAIDDQIGEILAALNERGERDNTYIIFTADHGEMLGDLGMYQKSVPYEGSIRIPLIIAGPGVQNGITDAIVELADLNPTICELAGLKGQESIDAKSFVPSMRDHSNEARTEGMSMLSNFKIIRTKEYKFVEHMNEGFELFDLNADPNELVNVAADNPEIVKEYRQRLHYRLWQEAGCHY